jgi:hypothetical protein
MNVSFRPQMTSVSQPQARFGSYGPFQLLQETLEEAEKNAGNFELDQIAWIIGNFPDNELNKPLLAENKPRLAALLEEMSPTSRTEALLTASSYRNREDLVGRVADLIIRVKS